MYEDIRESAGLIARDLLEDRRGRAAVLKFRDALGAEDVPVGGLSDSDVGFVLGLCIVRDAPELFPHDGNPLAALHEAFPTMPAPRAWAAYRTIRSDDLLRVSSPARPHGRAPGVGGKAR